MENPKVDLNMLLTGVLFLAVAGIAAAYSLQVEQSVKQTFYSGTGCSATNQTGCGLEYNATANAQTGIANITSQFGLIGTIIVAVVILGLIFMLFQFVKA